MDAESWAIIFILWLLWHGSRIIKLENQIKDLKKRSKDPTIPNLPRQNKGLDKTE
jgi:hypothetical protein